MSCYTSSILPSLNNNSFKWWKGQVVRAFCLWLHVSLDILGVADSPLLCPSCSFNFCTLGLTSVQTKWCTSARGFFCSLSHVWNRRLCDIYPQYCSSHHHQLDSHSLRVGMGNRFHSWFGRKTWAAQTSSHLLAKNDRVCIGCECSGRKVKRDGGLWGAPVALWRDSERVVSKVRYSRVFFTFFDMLYKKCYMLQQKYMIYVITRSLYTVIFVLCFELNLGFSGCSHTNKPGGT